MSFFWKSKSYRAPRPANPANAIYLGCFRDVTKTQAGAELTYAGERHLLLIGPNGSGKGTRLLVPNLLRLQDRSVIVIDPKGELTAITARQRSKFSRIVVLNPFDVLGLGGTGFNPLAALDPDSPTFVDDAAGLAEALIKIEPGEKDPHWSESARNLVAALIMWEVKEAKRRGRVPHMENVRRLLTEPSEYERDTDGKSKLVRGLKITAARMVAYGDFEIESLIGRFLRDNNEISGIQSAADRQTTWMLSPLMRANMAKNGIDFASLKEQPTTVYVILPAERMRTHNVWLRLVIVSALRSLYRPGGLRTLFMLDEFAQLGHLPPIEDAFGLVRGFGVQLWPILQDLNQLKELYGKRWETMTANSGVVQGFAPNDLTTAEWMSRRAGDSTVAAAGYNKGDALSSAGHGSTSQSTGLSFSQARRPLFLPQELMDLPAGCGVFWPAGTSKTVPFIAPSYWQVPELAAHADANPYFPSARTTPALPRRKPVSHRPSLALAVTKAMARDSYKLAKWSAPHIKHGLYVVGMATIRFARRSYVFALYELPPIMREFYATTRAICLGLADAYRAGKASYRHNRQKGAAKSGPPAPPSLAITSDLRRPR